MRGASVPSTRDAFDDLAGARGSRSPGAGVIASRLLPIEPSLKRRPIDRHLAWRARGARPRPVGALPAGDLARERQRRCRRPRAAVAGVESARTSSVNASCAGAADPACERRARCSPTPPCRREGGDHQGRRRRPCGAPSTAAGGRVRRRRAPSDRRGRRPSARARRAVRARGRRKPRRQPAYKAERAGGEAGAGQARVSRDPPRLRVDVDQPRPRPARSRPISP